jgi:Ca2+:H+ antiporter
MELMVAIIALVQDKVLIAKTSLVGSILSTLLLTTGLCFFFGGLNRIEQFFNTTVAQTSSELLFLTVGAILLPTMFGLGVNARAVTQISHGTALLLIMICAAFLYFQLGSHATVFSEDAPRAEPRRTKASLAQNWRSQPDKERLDGKGQPDNDAVAPIQAPPGLDCDITPGPGVPLPATSAEKVSTPSPKPSTSPVPVRQEEDDDDIEDGNQPELHLVVAVLGLVISTTLIGLCADSMLSATPALVAHGVSPEFIGLIIIPIAYNFAVHVTATTVAVKDKMDLAVGVGVGSALQVSLFVLPMCVIVGWCMHKDDMNLNFDLFQVAAMLSAVLIVNHAIDEGKSHWLKGMGLVCLYAFVAACAWCEFLSSI